MSLLSRRAMLLQSGACLGALAVADRSARGAVDAPGPAEPFGYCLNLSTIRGQELPVEQELEIAAEAGYQGIELWTRNLQRYREQGGSLADLRKRIADRGLSLENAIGFAHWAVEDDAKRAEGVETLRREMDLVAQLGGRRIAAPPAGLHDVADVDLKKLAARYRVVLELGRTMGVIPQLELWGWSKTLSRLSEGMFVAIEAAHPDACLLLDAFHLYKGGNDFVALKQLNGAALHIFHVNDYPADPPRETINDSQRIYPGDGLCPWKEILPTLYQSGFRGMLSLELFNPELWKQDPRQVARTGLAKMKAVVQRAFA